MIFSIIYYNIFIYKCQDVNCEFFVNYFLYKKWGIFIYFIIYFYIKVVNESIDIVIFFIFVGKIFYLLFSVYMVNVL